MGAQQPFLYDPVKTGGFDPRAVSRASRMPVAARAKQEGPLISFNQHPDSYLILPNGNSNAYAMNPSVKSWVKWMRIIQLVLRCLELLCAVGLLVLMILIKGVDVTSGWIMRIGAGVAIIHTVYAIYHLARKASGRTPGSSASYMLFASFFDVGITPCFAFSAFVGHSQDSNWTTILSNQDLIFIFHQVVFYVATAGFGLFVVSLALSLYLAVTFRKIMDLPPDMNPLEDNLTSRHKRNKSSIATTSTISEKRISSPLESKRSSGAAYEDLSRPPSIPFFSTRQGSTDSLSTYKSTPPPSRDSRHDLPSQQYQMVPSSPQSSVVELKRSSYNAYVSYNASTPPKRASYTEIPLSENVYQRSPRPANKPADTWFTSDSISGRRTTRSSPQKKGNYQALQQQPHVSANEVSDDHPNPLQANPPTPRHSRHKSRDSPLSEISNNRNSTDIADSSPSYLDVAPAQENLKAKRYGELKPGTPPIMIGAQNRQLSSGNDFSNGMGALNTFGRRGVSGKIAEEGRGGAGSGWGGRWRRSSQLGDL